MGKLLRNYILMLLLLSVYADDKIEGGAISKSFGILLFMLIPDYFFELTVEPKYK
jgi:hypothetical protein